MLKLQEIRNCRPKICILPRNLIVMHGRSVLYYILLTSQLCCISYVHQLTTHIFGRQKPQRVYEFLQCLRCDSFSLSHFTRVQCAYCIPPAVLVNDTANIPGGHTTCQRHRCLGRQMHELARKIEA